MKQQTTAKQHKILIFTQNLSHLSINQSISQ